MKKIVVDLDDTISYTTKGDYKNSKPDETLISKLKEYKQNGFEIIIHTSRNMRTFNGSIGKINANTLPIIIEWLNKHHVPYDEIITGKPWCGFEGFYIDDKSIRPDEFKKMSYDEISKLIKANK
ncbi:MAG: hypothetical protein AMXMBFR79_15900 [Chitinophagaceae bacterium]|nr:capsular biosynthesis protein [Chitinophagaceae bacterium]MCC6635576.1 capsular biosynthesis protein [Chitinophagaceae bacterium]MCZ2299393.1 capsular biosynthesis protein [Chitinophagales bacterium]